MQHCQNHQSLHGQFDHHESFHEENTFYLSEDDLEMDFDLGHWQPFGIRLVAGSPARPINVSIGSPFNDDGRVCMR